MKKRMGLNPTHTTLVEELLKESEFSIGAGQIKDRLWDAWGRFKPTSREIGAFLNLHPNMIRVKRTRYGAEYIWRE